MTDEEPPTKPRRKEDAEQGQRKCDVAEALLEERQVVASGRRRVNRPLDGQKQTFIEAFVREDRINRYHVWEEDIFDENLCAWEPRHKDTGDPLPPPKTLWETLTDEIVRVYSVAKQPVPVMAQAWASNLLGSDLGGKLGVLGHLATSALSVPLVLAHLESYGYDIPQRMAMGISRRTVLLLLNKWKWSPKASVVVDTLAMPI